MTAVIYARYSTDSQREESIEGQIRECTAYAEKNGFTVVKHYIDRAISAKNRQPPAVPANDKKTVSVASLMSSLSGNWIALPGTAMTVPGTRPN